MPVSGLGNHRRRPQDEDSEVQEGNKENACNRNGRDDEGDEENEGDEWESAGDKVSETPGVAWDSTFDKRLS